MLDLLERYPSPAQLAALTQKQLANRLVKLAPRMVKTWAAQILQALSEQTVVVLGTQAASIVLPRLAQQLAALRIQRDEVAKEVERLVLAHPLSRVNQDERLASIKLRRDHAALGIMLQLIVAGKFWAVRLRIFDLFER
jgi:uracil-DNA glycosylase